MVNLDIFKTLPGKNIPNTNTINEAGGGAYGFTPKHKLAQLAATGCINQTFYASAETKLADILQLTQDLDATFIAKTAIYAREDGYMKDMPALLAAVLAQKDVAVLNQCFGRIINNGKMLRNFVQIIRSGIAGRKSLGNRPKKLVQNWLLNTSEKQLLNASIGNNPTLADVVKMVHPKPQEEWRAAWFAWLIGRDYDKAQLPPITQTFENFKQALRDGVKGKDLPELPDVPFQMLTALDLNAEQWAAIARKGSWQMVRQNLNTFARHGVFDRVKMVDVIAAKLVDARSIAKASVMPYQLMAAYSNTTITDVPMKVRNALQDAMEIAVKNVPKIVGNVVVCPDVSFSMHSPVTGYRRGATTSVRCIDVAALVGAAVLRKNPKAKIMPFAETVRKIELNPRDSIMINAEKLARMPGGGTNVSAPLHELNTTKAKVDLVILVSDNESWFNSNRYGATATMQEWAKLKARCPNAKLVCIDMQPYGSTQAKEGSDVMNIGGFSDAVFDTIATFAKGNTSANYWVNKIEAISITASA
ncbi:vWA domain-containing protein [Entomomonas asaccharolytica]|uniref:RNA-binding protein n=1 Tax=Entomomonas asaccharolytica TaxID=2785331 RepID=A0A974NGN2_9GAMM|nr:RNA-binding protein [Entomomonas asaccharolytica]QQP86445.1 RNA-binding protein [Entomomonas asaccharolytica]